MRDEKPAGRPKDPERRHRILRAARALFLRDGFDGTSVEAIAREAGVSKVTVYGHFGTLSALLEAVVETEARAINRALSAHPISEGPPETRLTDFGLYLMALLRRHDAHELEHLVSARARDQPNLPQTYFRSGPARGMKMIADLLRPDLGDRAQEAASALFALWSGGEQHRASLGLRAPLTDEEMARHVRQSVGIVRKAFFSPSE
ncbi:MAG: TetR/AcrR family transcriptional regulator [Pseudomonadota bacterium]